MREYRIKPGWRWTFVVLGALFALGSLAGGVAAVVHGQGASRLWWLGVALVFVGLGAWTLVSMLRSRIRLLDDAIELQGGWLRRRLSLTDIEGRRRVDTQHASFIQLVSRTPGVSDLRVESYFDTDAAFDAWMARIPDLDARDAGRSADAYLATATDEAGRELKRRTLIRAHKVARIAQFLACAVGVWAFVYPYPYDLALLVTALVPLIATGIAATGDGAYTFDGGKNDVRPSLLVPLILPGMMLMVRAISDENLLDVPRLLWLSGIALLVWILVLSRLLADIRRTKWSVVLAAFLLAPYAFGTIALLNSRLDRGPPRVSVVRVLAKRVSTGKTTTYYLKVTPGVAGEESTEVSVVRDDYSRAFPGGTVCLYLWPGTLGARYYDVSECAGN